MNGLFEDLPEFPPALPDDELRLLAALPEWDTVSEIAEEEHAAARRLERRGLIKIQREKIDPCAMRPTWFGGVLPSATIRGIPA
jgi:hypothetical protein